MLEPQAAQNASYDGGVMVAFPTKDYANDLKDLYLGNVPIPYSHYSQLND